MFCFQMTTKDGVRKLYAVYYWIWKLGDTLSAVFCFVITYVTDEHTNLEAKLAMMASCFAIFVVVCATTSMVLLFIGEKILFTVQENLHLPKHILRCPLNIMIIRS